MKIEGNRDWIEMVLRNTDIMNTLNGGTSQAQISIKRNTDHYEITANAPGVDPGAFQVEVVDQHILLYHTVKFNSRSGDELAIPRVLASFPVSMEIDYENITARLDEGGLNVIVPINRLSAGYHKNIDIERS